VQRRREEGRIAEKRDDKEGVNYSELACEGEKVSVLVTGLCTPHSSPTALPPIHVYIVPLDIVWCLRHADRQAVRGQRGRSPHTLFSDCKLRSDSAVR
jgi:hypothetical protein